MSGFKGTQGRWIIKDNVASIQSENTGESITCWTGVALSNYSLKELEYKANSKLISKAPEMLEALSIILQELRDINVLENQANYIEQLIIESTTIWNTN